MKDGIEYAEMLGMNVSSCDVVVKPARKKRKKDVKDDVIAKVNERELAEDIVREYQNLDEYENVSPKEETQRAKRRGFDILKLQGVAIFALIVTILLTNIFWENSGINTLMKRVFKTEAQAVDARNYLSFSAKSPSNDLTVEIENGVMTFSGKGALYPVCDGTVSSIVEEEGKYTITINHSDSFKTVISDVDYVYTQNGDNVFAYVPVCYVAGDSAKVYMYDGDTLLTNYIVEDGVIIWES
ncbi:MAG: hypothetical protein IKA61_03045 [Clostridia bacterium]|nr:hypothetical protein [Clostridia bacterium]